MNAQQRKQIEELVGDLQTILDRIEEIKCDEEDKYENLPESLQNSDRGETLQEGIETLDQAYSYLSDAIDYLQEVE